MSDVMDMLGVGSASKPGGNNNLNVILQGKKNSSASQGKMKGKKPKGMKREVFDLLAKDGIVSSVQADSQPVQLFKDKRLVASKGRWVYEKINNPARSDNCESFSHWVRADLLSLEYPYAKFNVKFEPIYYTEDEYGLLFSNTDPVSVPGMQWTKEETDELIQLCNTYELRWPIIFDRAAAIQDKPLEELMYRYFSVVEKLGAYRRGVPLDALENGDSSVRYDVERERYRRKQQDSFFKKTKEEEEEELKIKEELKAVEAVMKKNKKNIKSENKAITSTSSSGGVENNPVSTGSLFDSRGIIQATVTNPSPNAFYYFPQPGRPALQSSRLYLTDEGAGLSKQLVAKMHLYLKEAGVPERPVPTKPVCDLVDSIRKDTITLISLTNAIKKKEKDLLTLKNPGLKAAPKSGTKGKPRARVKKENGQQSEAGEAIAQVADGTNKAQLAGLLEVFDPATNTTATKKRTRTVGGKKNSKANASTNATNAAAVAAEVATSTLNLDELGDADLIDFGLDDSFEGTHEESNKRMKIE